MKCKQLYIPYTHQKGAPTNRAPLAKETTAWIYRWGRGRTPTPTRRPRHNYTPPPPKKLEWTHLDTPAGEDRKRQHHQRWPGPQDSTSRR